ncbi:MAG: hypothetical protein LBJ33_11630 [Pseudomonas putida]|jgi:hypothetical protein|nr:hypothetical protein [Pseudomonas putida]
MNRASFMALLDTVLLRSWRIGVDPIVASAALTADQLGQVVVDATAGAVAITLPSASAVLGRVEVTLRRKDVTANVLSIVAVGADRIVLPGATDGIGATELIFPGDYLTLRADGAGKWWCVGQAQLPGSIASGLTVFGEAGVFTFMVPPVLRSGRRQAVVTVIGGGGGGGNSGSTGTGDAGSGGGGGGLAKKRIDLSAVISVPVTVGSGGAAQVAGGTSSFGVYVSAPGGGAAGPSRGAGGIGVGGDINGTLGAGFQRHTNGTAQISGHGAGPGGGPSVENGSLVGSSASGHGSGGSGGTGGAAGGAGSRGRVDIVW